MSGELLAGQSITALRSLRSRQSLLALQACTTVVILICAGLLIRAVHHGFNRAPGIDVDRTLFVSISEPIPLNAAVSRETLAAERNARLMSSLTTLPGVIEVASGAPPLVPISSEAVQSLRPRSFRVGDRQHEIVTGVLRGSPNVLSALGVAMLAGRPLTAADAFSQPRPVVISRSLATALFPEGNALHQAFGLQERGWGQNLVVGISADLAYGSLAAPANGVIVSVWREPGAMSRFIVRTSHLASAAAAVGRRVKSQGVRALTAQEAIASDIGRQRLGAWFFTGFGIAALLLGMGSAFGLVAYVAESRRREFGIRMVLGADRNALVRNGLAAALLPVSVGLVAGIALGAIAARLLSGHLVGIGALDPLTYALVTGLMLCSAGAAGLVASWRLRRTTPSDALRTT